MKRGLFRFVVALALAAFGLAAQASLISLKQRDYSGNYTATDRSWFYKYANGTLNTGGGGVYPSVEWVLNRGENYPVVYTRGGTATIVLTFQNPQFDTISATFSVSSARLHIPDTVTGGSDEYVTLTASVTDDSLTMSPFNGTDTCSVALSGLPSYVTCGYIEITATVVGGQTTYWNSGSNAQWELTLLTQSTPIEVQSPVWCDLLLYACTWAHGMATDAAIAEMLARGFFFSGRWVYNPSQPNFWVSGDDNDVSVPSSYKLKLALGCATGTGMDCKDVAGLLYLCYHALGIDCDCGYLIGADYPYAFRTNYLCPAGSNPGWPTPDNYQQFDFTHHQVLLLGDDVYDGSCAYIMDLSGHAWMLPATGWPSSDHWQSWNGSQALGLVFGPAQSLTAQVFDPGGPISRQIASYIYTTG